MICENDPTHWLGNLYFEVRMDQQALWQPERNMFPEPQVLFESRENEQRAAEEVGCCMRPVQCNTQCTWM